MWNYVRYNGKVVKTQEIISVQFFLFRVLGNTTHRTIDNWCQLFIFNIVDPPPPILLPPPLPFDVNF